MKRLVLSAAILVLVGAVSLATAEARGGMNGGFAGQGFAGGGFADRGFNRGFAPGFSGEFHDRVFHDRDRFAARGDFRMRDRFFREHFRDHFRERRFFFLHHALFRSFFFFGRPVLVPVPIVLAIGFPAFLYGPVFGSTSCYEYGTLGPIPDQQDWGIACLQPNGAWGMMP